MIIGVIPARYQSTRLPGKPLQLIAGKPMIQWVYEGSSQSKLIDEVWVATDDERILRAVQSFGGRAVMTSPDHQTGTDRLAEVAAGYPCDLVVNIQGDEPLIQGSVIDQVVRPLIDDPTIPMGTAMAVEDNLDSLQDPSVVKVVPDGNGFALYFSRSMIPYPRKPGQSYRHIGLYVYRRDFLLKYHTLPAAPSELMESLEQLRALHYGYRIKVTEVTGRFVGVDTPEDLEEVRKILGE
ncbi:MAG TPA: 3-deoxy-manno-octulosonate cytidylyltransferase [Bacillota bacterium]|nr:3-deoxy-manno-octulosonate cytidylyltransferase [Bacillota bacterium]